MFEVAAVVLVVLMIVLALREQIGTDRYAYSKRAAHTVPYPLWQQRRMHRDHGYYTQLPEHQLLLDNFTFYEQLSSEGRRRFLHRTLRFRSKKVFRFYFHPEEPHWVPQTLISAAAVQLTFGLERYMISRYIYVHVYEHSFLLPRGRGEAYGAVGVKDSLMISWEPFKEGYRNSHNSWNLGLHEWTHALEIAHLLEQGAGAHFARYYNAWREEAMRVLETLDLENTGFRHFPKDHYSEFMPVCMERFFENPESFRSEFPELFERTRLLFNCNPLQPATDDFNYALQQSRYRNMHHPDAAANDMSDAKETRLRWPVIFFIVTWAAALLTLIYIVPQTYISYEFKTQGSLSTLIIGLAGFYYLLRIKAQTSMAYYLGFVLFAFLPAGLTTGLLLNYSVTSYDHSFSVNVNRVEDLYTQTPWALNRAPYRLLAYYQRCPDDPRSPDGSDVPDSLVIKNGEWFRMGELSAIGYDSLGPLPDTPDMVEVKCVMGMFNMPIYKGYIYYDF